MSTIPRMTLQWRHVVYSIAYSDTDRRKHESSMLLAKKIDFWLFLIFLPNFVLCMCNMNVKVHSSSPFYCSHFKFSMIILLDSLFNISSGFGQNVFYFRHFFNCAFSLSICGPIKYESWVFNAVIMNGLKSDMLMYPDHLQKLLDFVLGLLSFLILALFWLSETGLHFGGICRSYWIFRFYFIISVL